MAVKSGGVVGAGYEGQPLVITQAPPAYVIRQQAGTNLPASASRIGEALGGTLLGAALTGVLTALLPADEKLLGPVVSGALGTVAAMASPIGTWGQEIGQGAMTSSGFVLFLKFTNQLPGS